MPLVLHPTAVLVTPDTAAAVLGTTAEDIRNRVDAGELVAFDFARTHQRRKLRIWVDSLMRRSVGAYDLSLVPHQCARALYRQRPEVAVVEIGRRCALDRSVLHRMQVRGELDRGLHGVPVVSWQRVLDRRLQRGAEGAADSVARTHAACLQP